ncbi:Uma2 family endonuclease [Streptomyces sp. NPDC048506]|uniref:Uma2 family endonuclease n=1 Tax=Streptomyces sp. NPDC048506 TaxID=3155028 RepID=UPI00341D57C5
MTAMAQEPVATNEETLLNGFFALETPEGFRAELIEGEIVVTPPPDNRHERVFSKIVKQVLAKSHTDMDVSGNKGIQLSPGGLYPKNYVIPDATFAPSTADLFGLPGNWVPSDAVALVVEVTSSKPHRDRVTKRDAYARANIPLYLLVDREKSTITLFSEPSEGDYAGSISVPLGKPVPLPAPFSFDLETIDFL